MDRIEAAGDVGISRRTLLRAGSLGMLGLGGPAFGAGGSAPGPAGGGPAEACILIILVGGPSQVDTWDPKPDAPAEVRGPFRPIATRVPGVFVSEMFPRLAAILDRVALVRSLRHEGPAIHDAGHQLLQTGRLARRGASHAAVGSVVGRLLGPRAGMPPYVLLPRPITATDGNLDRGHAAGPLGPAHDPVLADRAPAGGRPLREALDLRAEPATLRERFGDTPFGRDCLRARRLVERGARFVTVNMDTTVFDGPTWDMHGSSPFWTTEAAFRHVAPRFDAAYAALIDDLDRRGLLGSTLVVAAGEFGRTPQLNASGGRDHHPACWTGLFAGGPVRGGRVVGASDATGSLPADRPVALPEVAATIYHGLGISLDQEIPGPDGRPERLVAPGVAPIAELT